MSDELRDRAEACLELREVASNEWRSALRALLAENERLADEVFVLKDTDPQTIITDLGNEVDVLQDAIVKQDAEIARLRARVAELEAQVSRCLHEFEEMDYTDATPAPDNTETDE